MLDQLENVLLGAALVVREEDIFSHRERAPAYRLAFHGYGIHVGETNSDHAAARIAGRPAAVAARLIAALDDWQTIADIDRDERAWLSKVVAPADNNPWRREMRAAWERRDRPALQKLASTVDVAQQPPATLQSLARFLESVGAHGDQVALLRRGQQHYPADFWMNQELAAALWRRGAGQGTEALPFQIAAVALRPQSSGAHSTLGWVLLLGKGNVDEALAAFHKAVELAPSAAHSQGSLGYALHKSGDSAAHRAVEPRKSESLST